MRRFLVLAGAIGLLAGDASAAISVLGGGQAQACYHLVKEGRYDDGSIAVCTDALENELLTGSDRGGTFVNRGVMRLQRGQYEAAHADFDAGVALIPHVGEGLLNRGAMFVAERRYSEGLADLDKALSLGVKEPAKLYFNRAIAHEGLDDETAAYLDYQQAEVLDPTWDLPRRELKRFTVSRR